MRCLALLLVAVLADGLPIRPTVADDRLESISRQIGAEPDYVAAPRYCLAVFGPEAKTRVWIALDKSDAEAERYDVAYADLNANGDLTDEGERFAAGGSPVRQTFAFGEFADPNSDARHSDFQLNVSERSMMLSVLWRGKHKFGGGYPREGNDGYMQFGDSPEKAPVAWLNGDGPFRFQRWYGAELPIGGEGDVKVFLGQQGLGHSSFCAFQRHVLPEEEPVLATLVYTDSAGMEQRLDYKLKERC